MGNEAETQERVRWPVIGGGVALAAILTVGAMTMRGGSISHAAEPLDPATAGDSLIGLWIDSVGGMEAYEAFRSARFTIATVLYDTLSGRTKRNRPRYAWIKKGPHGEETRVERWETSGFIEQGFNGLTAWATLDGAMLSDTAKDHREALYVARDLFYWAGLPFKLRDPGVQLTYHGLQSRPGAEIRTDPDAPRMSPPQDGYHAVGVSFDEGVGEHQDVFTYYFSPGEGFPTEMTYVEDGKTEINRALWGETERVGSIQYPYVTRRDHITESGKLFKALVMYDFEVNPEIPQAFFEIP